MKIDVLKSLVNLLDPMGIIEICPKDEYDDISIKVCQMMECKQFQEIQTYIESLYINEKSVEKQKVKEFMNLLIHFDKN